MKSDLDAHYTSVCSQSISVGGRYPRVESFSTFWPLESAEKPKEVLGTHISYTPFSMIECFVMLYGHKKV